MVVSGESFKCSDGLCGLLQEGDLWGRRYAQSVKQAPVTAMLALPSG